MDTKKYCLYQWRLYPRPASNGSPRKFEPKISDFVHVRPKSAKEIGYTGRVTSINANTATVTDGNSVNNDQKVSQKCSKKRKLTEDVRVTIQQHCYHHRTQKYEDCITCHSTKHDVRPSRLVPVYDLHLKNKNMDKGSEAVVLLTPDTTTYRQLATSHLRPNDNVLEIGCSTGECTALLLRRNLLLRSQHSRQMKQHGNKSADVVLGKIVGFDTGTKILKQADNRLRKEYDQSGSTLANEDDAYSKIIQLHRIDALADPKGAYALATANNTYPGVVLVDIGGNRELDGVVRMIQWVQTAFQDESPRLILVKSEALVEELLTAVLSCHTNDNTACTIPSVSEEGVITRGQNWFNSLIVSPSLPAAADDDKANKSLSRQQLSSRYSHPKKVPLGLSPIGTPICRYHNYHPDGCTKFNKSKSSCDDLLCQYDHEHCHWCQVAGHIALNCPSLK
ncbi:hypothetical protein ACHAXM_004376 [Skeletonema potamos]